MYFTICTHHFPLPEQRSKFAWLKLEKGVRVALESRRKSEEGEEHARLEAEEEARLVEEARLKAEEEEQARLRDD